MLVNLLGSSLGDSHIFTILPQSVFHNHNLMSATLFTHHIPRTCDLLTTHTCHNNTITAQTVTEVDIYP
jgi:hypothetical protein